MSGWVLHPLGHWCWRWCPVFFAQSCVCVCVCLSDHNLAEVECVSESLKGVRVPEKDKRTEDCDQEERALFQNVWASTWHAWKLGNWGLFVPQTDKIWRETPTYLAKGQLKPGKIRRELHDIFGTHHANHRAFFENPQDWKKTDWQKKLSKLCNHMQAYTPGVGRAPPSQTYNHDAVIATVTERTFNPRIVSMFATRLFSWCLAKTFFLPWLISKFSTHFFFPLRDEIICPWEFGDMFSEFSVMNRVEVFGFSATGTSRLIWICNPNFLVSREVLWKLYIDLHNAILHA